MLKGASEVDLQPDVGLSLAQYAPYRVCPYKTLAHQVLDHSGWGALSLSQLTGWRTLFQFLLGFNDLCC